MAAEPDDVDSYVEAVMRLIEDANVYRTLCESCSRFQNQFYDGKLGLRAVLKKIIVPGP